MPRTRTSHTGVYYRESTKRRLPDGTFDICYDIHFKRDGKDIWQTVGWKSAGVTLQDAVRIRQQRIDEKKMTEMPEKDHVPSGKRIKTRYVGVYVRVAKLRLAADGKADRCFDIHYKRDGKYVWEKVGWRSEGYTVQDAIAIRGKRIKSDRHPEEQYLPKRQDTGKSATIGDLWRHYARNCLPHLKNARVPRGAYNVHIRPRFEQFPAEKLDPLEVERFKLALLSTRKANGEHISKGYVNAILGLLGQLLTKGLEWGLIESFDPHVLKDRIRNAETRREKYLSPKEISIIFDGLRMTSLEVFHAARVSLYSGLRVSEVASLKAANVDIPARLLYTDGKTGKRVAYFPACLEETMRCLKENALPDGRCFSMTDKSLSKAFARVVDATGLNEGKESSQKIVFHTLRHTFCSILAMRGVSLYTIGELAGHRQPSTTRRYAKLSPDTKRAALKKLDNLD